MDVRPYLPADRDSCLTVFDTNTPEGFRVEERREFEEFLESSAEAYFVMEHEGVIVGCGGYSIAADQTTARLLWGMVGKEWQRQGLGRFLLLFRLREMGRAGVQIVSVAAPEGAAGFFEKQGFRAVGDGTGPVEMVRKLAVCP